MQHHVIRGLTKEEVLRIIIVVIPIDMMNSKSIL